MMRKTCTVLIVLICLFATSAFAYRDEYRTYLTIGGGASLLEDIDINHSLYGPLTLSSDTGYNGFIATGMAYDVGRIEFSASYHVTDFDEATSPGGPSADIKGELKAAVFLASVYYDLNKDGVISPYFGGGVGIASVKAETITNGDDNNFAYQLGFGLSFNLSQNTQFDLGYKLLGIVEPRLGDTEPDNMSMHNANIGLRFLF